MIVAIIIKRASTLTKVYNYISDRQSPGKSCCVTWYKLKNFVVSKTKSNDGCTDWIALIVGVAEKIDR